jgi:hypothetical protein
MKTNLLVAAASAVICSSCQPPIVREITAANNGVKFHLRTSDTNPKKWEYHGPHDSQLRAHGMGSYALRDTFYGGYHYQGSGRFKNGLPDGVHTSTTKAPVVNTTNRYRNGEFLGYENTRNDVPEFLAGVATAGMSAMVSANRTPGTGSALMKSSSGLQYTDVTANYPEGYAYNVTTYIGQYAMDDYSFGTIYGITTRAVAEQNLEAGRRVYGGDDSLRPGWFHIEAVPVRPGSKIKVGIVGIR